MYEVTFDQVEQEFRVLLERGLYATVKFERQENIFMLTSTKVPEPLQGKGYGQLIMEQVLLEIEKMNGKVVAKCSFVVDYLEKNPQWQYLTL